MDKREPDDPSPYLLAIWSPGKDKMLHCRFPCVVSSIESKARTQGI